MMEHRSSEMDPFGVSVKLYTETSVILLRFLVVTVNETCLFPCHNSRIIA